MDTMYEFLNQVGLGLAAACWFALARRQARADAVDAAPTADPDQT